MSDERTDVLDAPAEESTDAVRKVPGSRLGRLARLASVGLRTGASMLADRDGTSAAKHAAEVFGTMRGLAAKVGQMASYVDGVVPEAQRSAYEKALRVLQAQAPRSSPKDVRRTLEEELGAPVEEKFREFCEVPVASASIGQVHRAVLPTGEEVAVKVQHPGIVAAVESDLSNTKILETFAGVMAGPRIDTKQLFSVIEQRVREELDYRNEAENTALFRALHRDDASIHIPEVFPAYSTSRVITTRFVRGMGFEEACTAPESLRRVWVETIWRFVFRGVLVGGLFNADPHPGNYLFHSDGSVTFLDYGCVQKLDHDYLARSRKVHECALLRDEAGYAIAASELVKAKKGRLEPLAVAYARLCFEPIFASPYRITREYAASLVSEMKDIAVATKKIPVAECFDMPPEMIFINRLQFGLYSLLARLDVSVDYARVERAMIGAETHGADLPGALSEVRGGAT